MFLSFQSLSKFHANFQWTNSGFVITDLNSKTKTRVNNVSNEYNKYFNYVNQYYLKITLLQRITRDNFYFLFVALDCIEAIEPGFDNSQSRNNCIRKIKRNAHG